MISSTQIRFAPAVTSMRDYLEPYLPWLEKVVGCSYPETLTFETEWPIGRFVIGDLLKGVSLDEEVGWESEWKAQIDHWELASETGPRISLTLSRKQGASIVDREAVWQAQWRDCPIANAAILKRPGRFDRVVAFRPPSRELCADYLLRLSRGTIGKEELHNAVLEVDGLSFAQLRESYILAGQLALDSRSDLDIEHLRAGLKLVDRGMVGVDCGVGFRNRPEAAKN
jgi:hypothetical protein